MDCKEKKMPSELAHSAQLFLDFMTRITKLEELVAIGSRLLIGFHQELEVHACQQGLQEHLAKAKVLLNELECLMEDAVGVMHDANENLSQVLDKLPVDGLVYHATCFEKDETESGCLQCLKVSDYAIMMRIIYSMVTLDYTTQEKIVMSLDHNSSSVQLESYCLMWDLRPFVNDNIMHQAWRYIR